MSEENGKVCCNCAHNIRTGSGANIQCHCDIDNHYIGYVDCMTYWCRRWSYAFDELIDAAPTVDAVQVIRCKDCKYYDGYYCHNNYWGDGYGNYPPPIKEDDGYCDWAERKDVQKT